MARKGKVLWEVSKRTGEDGTVSRVTHYALREDGALITKFRTLKPDGSVLNDYGWSVHLRRPDGDDVLFRLKANGYA